MKVKLPKLVIIIVFLAWSFFNVSPVFSATPTAAPTTSPTPIATAASSGAGFWQPDQEVTFAGKIAARASDSLDWVIGNYRWASFKPNAETIDERNPFNPIWRTIRNIIYFVLTLFILAGAFLIIITHGESLSIKKFIPRFVVVLILVTFSFSLIQFLYQITDLVQGFFLRRPGGGPNDLINSHDLLSIAFDYQSFEGFRRVGANAGIYQYDEAAFMSLLLVKLTAATYYVMFIILILRKIILWFFIIVSPVFPLLILFYPLKNSAKIWLGEFFRWLLYGPLFAIFLFGLVKLWQIYIPIDTPKLPCERPYSVDNKADLEYKYPTSVNILLGGPCQKLVPDSNKENVDLYNSLNNPDSFIQYVVALLMLWMVILMPFILLKIFLDYLNSVSIKDNPLTRYWANKPQPQNPQPDLSKSLPSAKPMIDLKPPPILPPTIGSAGLAREIPQTNAVERDTLALRPQFMGNYHLQQDVKQVLDLTRLQIPTLREVSKFDTAVSTKSKVTERTQLLESLSRLSNSSPIMSESEKSQLTKLMGQLKLQSQQGNPVAKGITEASKKATEAEIPEDNKVQTVNVEDYEEVKKAWLENYRKLEPADDSDGSPVSRIDWIKRDINQIPQVIDKLLSADPVIQAQGKEMVSKILPFLLLGGFSKAEIVTYLKAKLEAAKEVLGELVKELTDEDNKVAVEVSKKEEPKVMMAEAEIEEDKNHIGEKPVTLYPEKSESVSSGEVKIGQEDYSSIDDKNSQ